MRNGENMRSVLLVTALIIACASAHAADTQPDPPVVPPAEATKASSAALAPAVLTPADLKTVEKLVSDLALTDSRLASAESSISKSAEKADQVAMRSSWFALGTVLGTALLTAVVTIICQFQVFKHQRKLSARDAQNDISNSYVDWQLKQLSELYGPLRALLGQSNEIYRQMNRALIGADSTRFRLDNGDDFDGKEFQIKIGEEWMRFRTVQHLGEVYHKKYGVEPYFDNVVEVGGRMANLIREKAGYALSEDIELLKYLSQYLAHYLVLSRLHEQVKIGIKIAINDADREATFPNQIQALVSNGYEKINRLVMDWRKPQSSV